MADDKVLEEIRFHQDVIAKDSSSPLYQIREKEIEISGRVLAARQKAEAIVADARRKAAETVNNAQGEGDAKAREHEAKALADAEAQAKKLRAGIGDEVAAIGESIAARKAKAAETVVKAVAEV
ncbi:MAG TPA: hypothetical protein VF902_03760 [Coriobacteriia bacterium]